MKRPKPKSNVIHFNKAAYALIENSASMRLKYADHFDHVMNRYNEIQRRNAKPLPGMGA